MTSQDSTVPLGSSAAAKSTGGNAERAYREIKRRILANDMSPGAQYLEQELAEALGMSRTPVREAAIRLENEGIVEVKPRHGIRVLPVSSGDMREIYEILTDLESTAARLVAERGLGPNDIRVLEETVEQMVRTLDEDDLEAWAQADERFHKLLVGFSGNARLNLVVNMFWDQAHRARMLTLQMRPKPTESNLDHAAVVDAIKRGDADAAYRIHREHRVRAGETLIGLLDHYELRNI